MKKNARCACTPADLWQYKHMEKEINLAALETKTLTALQWVIIRNALEDKMEEFDNAASWAESKGYSSEDYYRNEYAKRSQILKAIA